MNRFDTYSHPLLLLALLFATAISAQAQTITFSFDNGSFSADGSRYEFDVMAAADQDPFYGDSQIYINYNSDGFGENVASTAIITEGTLMQDIEFGGAVFDKHRIVNITDNAANILAITTEYDDSINLFSTQLTETPQQVLRVSLPIAEPTERAGLSFNQGLMEGEQFTAEGAQYEGVEIGSGDNSLLDSELPIELSGFTASFDGTAVVLDWTTASELNNAGFEIQHQVATVEGAEPEWETLAFVEGAGTTTEARTYRYRVTDGALGLQHYRLKQLDFDGAMNYSEAVEVTVELAEAYRLSEAYPNPFNPQTTVTLAVREAQDLTIEIYDALGRRVETLYRGGVEGNTNRSFVWQAAQRPSGLYFIRITGADFVETRQVTLLK